MANCATCTLDVYDGDVVDGADLHAGMRVHLLDTGPRHSDLAAHPVEQGERFGVFHDPAAPAIEHRLSTPLDDTPDVEVEAELAATANLFWADVSSWQHPVNNSYPRPMLSFKLSQSTTYTDTNAATNLGWAKRNVGPGKKLLAFEGYHVWYPGNLGGQLAYVKSRIGAPHPLMLLMVDVESWGGAIRGDHSTELTELVTGLADWLGNRARVSVYGNEGDLANIFPHRPSWLTVHIASYGSVEPAQRHGAWQYYGGLPYPVPSGYPTTSAPFGACDHNVAHSTGDSFLRQWGLTSEVDLSDPTVIANIARAVQAELNKNSFLGTDGGPHQINTLLIRNGTTYFLRIGTGPAIYMLVGAQLLWIPAVDYNALGAPWYKTIQPTGALAKLPIVPGTTDPRVHDVAPEHLAYESTDSPEDAALAATAADETAPVSS